MIAFHLAYVAWVKEPVSAGVTDCCELSHSPPKMPIWALASIYTNTGRRLWNCQESRNAPGSLYEPSRHASQEPLCAARWEGVQQT